MDNPEFLATVGPAAIQIEQERGYPAEALLAQVHLESNGLALFPAGSNNVLGVKFNGKGEYVEAETTEYDIDGNPYTTMAKWQKYPSIHECLQGWANLMDKPWYAQAKPYRSNWTAFLALIWFNGAESVYATDPLYLWKAVKRACDVGIPEWCTKYRMQTNSPPVTVLLNGKQLTDEYRLVKDSSVGKLRPFLEELKRCGYIYGFDWKTKTLKVDR